MRSPLLATCDPKPSGPRARVQGTSRAMSINQAMVEAALSLVTDQVKAGFLGGEVQEKSEQELSMEGAWKALARGDSPLPPPSPPPSPSL